MKIVSVDEARARLSEPLEQAAQGQSFVIAKEGRPMVTVSAINEPKTVHRLGFMAGEIEVPADFDRMAEGEVEQLFRRKSL